MQAGKLRHRIKILKAVDQRGATFGEAKLAYETVAIVRAAVIPLAGKEFWGAAQTEAGISHRIEIRYLPGITPKHRIEFNGRIFEIVSVLNLEERNREIHLMCWEKIA